MTQASQSTPMMQQYLQVKDNHSDCLVLFRMGDFYELFFEDAIKAAPILEVTLTKRGKTDSQDIPMCGVPHHSAELYIRKLIKQGLKVAICDQLETPQEAKKRGGHKAVVQRDVVRIITPGTLTEENFLEAKQSNYLLAINKYNDCFSIAYADISTLEFKCLTADKNHLQQQISRIAPSEIIIADSLVIDPDFKPIYEAYKKKIVTFSDSHFSFKKNQTKLLNNFNVKTLDSFGEFTESMVISCGVVLEYISITQKKENVLISPPKIEITNQYMVIDEPAINNLEIFRPTNTAGRSLFSVINKTQCPLGSRLLYKFLSQPTLNIDELNERYDAIEAIINNSEINEFITKKLKLFPDLERIITRLSYLRGSPGDLYKIQLALETAKEIGEFLNKKNIPALNKIIADLGRPSAALALLNEVLIEKDLHLNQEDFISPEYSPELKELYELRDHGQDLIDQLREKYREQTGIPNLKIEFNNVLGYYIEVTKTNISKVTSEDFIHRQTMVNCTRYFTDDLKEIEGKLSSAKDQIALIQNEIFQNIIGKIIEEIDSLNEISQQTAKIDVLTAFANLAIANKYCRPTLKNNTSFDVEDGRHPVVEVSNAAKQDQQFIPNSCILEDSQKLWLITGPNMAGKSTFLRQNALIAIMAQAGCFIPAKKATIGIVDRVFCRVGAGDDLAQGRSTFLVEMIETAAILNQATEKSLVILDEVGRGTSTYDGLSIAWSCLEHIHNKINCRTLFATHYHELVDLTAKLNSMKCYTAKVKEWENQVIFLHKIVKGVADKSYGINVAELAGIPKTVTERAKTILKELHQETKPKTSKKPPVDDLFAYQYRQESTTNNAALEKLRAISPDDLSPKEALELVYALKSLLKD
ncbi:MAG: DNA mismatch repair protein MutS [Rickettsiales bacterium]